MAEKNESADKKQRGRKKRESSLKVKTIPDSICDDGWEKFIKDKYYHFSSKVTNSNAAPVGVRISREQALDLPYVSARTIMNSGIGIPLDYVVNPQSKRPAYIQSAVQSRIQDSQNPSLKVEPEEVCEKILVAYDAVIDNVGFFGTDIVPPEIRQILLPASEKEYRCVSPLGSAGLAGLVRDAAQAEGGARISIINNDSYKIGGANSVNVGLLVGRVKPLMFHPPQKDLEIKKVLAWYYKGYLPALRSSAVIKYSAWLDSVKGKEWSLAVKKRERQFIEGIVSGLNKQADSAKTLLLTRKEELPVSPDAADEELMSPTVPNRDLSMGWLLRDGRSHEWKELASEWLFHRFQNYSFNGRKLGIGADDRRRLISAITEVL